MRRGGQRRQYAAQWVVRPWLRERDDVAERSGGSIALGQRRGAPALRQGLQHGSVVDGAGAPEDGTGGDQRRYQDGRHPNSEAREIEPVLSHCPVARRSRAGWRGEVVVTPAVLIVGDDEQRGIPCLAAAQCDIDVVKELLPFGDIVVRVLAVACSVPTGLEESVGRKRPGRRALLEVAEVAEMRVVSGLGVGKRLARQRIAVVAVDRPVEAPV